MSFRDLEEQLACWSERLQQYDLDIQHRSGKLHKNADGLSRLPCAEFGCKYCLRAEEKETARRDECVTRIVLEEDGAVEWRREQQARIRQFLWFYGGRKRVIVLRGKKFQLRALLQGSTGPTGML